MVKVNRIISIDYELHLNLKEEENASKLINRLLAEHYASDDPKAREIAAKTQKEILERTKAQLVYEEEMSKIRDFLISIDEQEYREGVKQGKWNGITDYARVMLGLPRNG